MALKKRGDPPTQTQGMSVFNTELKVKSHKMTLEIKEEFRLNILKNRRAGTRMYQMRCPRSGRSKIRQFIPMPGATSGKQWWFKIMECFQTHGLLVQLAFHR
jgi:hypothetical protein